jgi:hypothetical protein
VQTHWRLAFMFDAPDHDLAALSGAMTRSGTGIRALAAGHHVRMGVADRHSDLGTSALRQADKGWADVDGAIEFSIANERVAEIPDLCRALRPVIAAFCSLDTVDVMAGPMFHMVPVRPGGTFLSLAFQRDPAVTSAGFRDWWYNRHAALAVPVLGGGLLAYDQVHVDHPISLAASQAFGSSHVAYDAYDNLTWADRYGYLDSISDAAAMGPLMADEAGFIDAASRRSAIMTELR